MQEGYGAELATDPWPNHDEIFERLGDLISLFSTVAPLRKETLLLLLR